MSDIISLSSQIESHLPAGLVNFVHAAGESAQRQGQRLYLVGGVVRDLLLGRANLDLDLVVEGDAINLAQEMMGTNQGKVITHHRFGTAKLQWDFWSVDLATARSETYAKPGTLPAVKPGTIKNDLSRRDFTVNAMAIELNPDRYGILLDPHKGRNDLKHRLIRILHEKSFIDDATRIWRGLRYEQRLSFQLEAVTLQRLQRDIDTLTTISGDRIRHELELALGEAFPENIMRRADELGVLAKLHPSLCGDSWLTEKFTRCRKLSLPDTPPERLYLALLAYRLTGDEIEQFTSYLRLPKLSAQSLRDMNAIKGKIESLSVPGLAPSHIHSLLHGYTPTALTANLLATDSLTAAEHIELYQNVLHYVRPALTGGDLKRLGVLPGPLLKQMLTLLLEAKLDGKVSDRKDEEEMVKVRLRS